MSICDIASQVLDCVAVVGVVCPHEPEQTFTAALNNFPDSFPALRAMMSAARWVWYYLPYDAKAKEAGLAAGSSAAR
jgi:hypothetical protein